MTVKEGWNGRFFEDFDVRDVYEHPLGRTITTADNIWFTLLTQNTAPIRFDHQYASQTEFGKPLVNSCLTLALVTGQSVTDISQNHLIDDRHLPRVDSQLSLEAGRIDPRVLMRSCCIEYLHPTVCRPFSPSGFGQLRKGSARADEDDQAQCQVDGPIGRVGSKRDRQLPGLRNHVWDGVVCVESPAANRVVIGSW